MFAFKYTVGKETVDKLDIYGLDVVPSIFLFLSRIELSVGNRYITFAN